MTFTVKVDLMPGENPNYWFEVYRADLAKPGMSWLSVGHEPLLEGEWPLLIGLNAVSETLTDEVLAS